MRRAGLYATRKAATKEWTLLPIVGSVLFVLLYSLAAVFYPGGSQADKNAKGFSWLHNYWCNLLSEKGINGELNTGRPFALAAMAVLMLTLLIFWIVSLWQLQVSKKVKATALAFGFIAMALLPFLSSAHHDAVLNTAASFGLVCMVVIYAALYKSGYFLLFAFGLLNLLLILLNNYIYYISGNLYWLPLVQKITFASFLLWACGVSLVLFHRTKRDA